MTWMGFPADLSTWHRAPLSALSEAPLPTPASSSSSPSPPPPPSLSSSASTKTPPTLLARYPAAQEAFAALALTIGQYEPVTVCVPPHCYDRAVVLLSLGDEGGEGGGVRVVEMSSNDGAWFRDQAPTFVHEIDAPLSSSPSSPSSSSFCSSSSFSSSPSSSSSSSSSSSVVGVCWNFDAWGQACYGDFTEDAKISRKVCALERLRAARPGYVLEGGSIHVDGEGTLLTTRECLLEPSPVSGRRRNGDDVDAAAAEAFLRRYLGARKVLWLPYGVAVSLHHLYYYYYYYYYYYFVFQSILVLSIFT